MYYAELPDVQGIVLLEHNINILAGSINQLHYLMEVFVSIWRRCQIRRSSGFIVNFICYDSGMNEC
jgi:hypothetical protein